MENIMRTKLTACALVTTLAITGCANMNDTQKKTATGAGAGAVAGAVLGAVTGPGGWGRAAVGAAIGGLVGGGAGYLWGNHMEKQKQEMQTATQGTGVIRIANHGNACGRVIFQRSGQISQNGFELGRQCRAVGSK